jgi:hypothetical protein
MMVAQLALKSVLPQATTSAVAAPSIRQNAEVGGFRIALSSLFTPPFFDGIDGELRGVMTGTDEDRAPVGPQVIDGVRDGDP